MCRNEMDKACFQYSMAYGDFEDLAKRTASDKVLRNKAFDIAKNPKYDRYQRGLASMVYFDKNLQLVVLMIIKLNKMNKWLKNYTNQLLKNSKKKSLFFIKTIFGVLI